MLVVAAGIATIILTRGSSSLAPATSALTATPGGIALGEVLNGTFSTDSFNGTWISEFFNRNFKAPSGWRVFKYVFSPSRKYLLIIHDVQKLFRYSYLARHTILNLETGETVPLAPTRVRTRSEQPPLLFATWAPTDDALAFVSHNDLYYTTEEILSSNSALWFNPDGRRLAFATFNDSRVDTMNFPLYGRPGDLSFQYPIQQSIKYPKPGRANPVVDLWVVDLGKLVSGSGETVTRLPPPTSLASVDHYFTTVGWATPDKVSVMWMNRHQNVNIISLCSVDGVCKDDLVHESPDHAWNDLYTTPKFDEVNGDTYLIILPTNQGEKGNFKHINLRRSSDKTLIPLTTGTYEVVEILSWDQKNHLIYFTAAPAGKPGQRHIYYVRERLLDRSLPLEKRLEIDVEGGFKAQVSMKMPPDYNPTR
ncbi:Inactive dipeptidyl peptidase 10-like 1 [Homarus americanus]|uniref:Inactive dipeptidyl peptidase 10-like 1 n=1 Tax=Homarus americanus TaxID=6706 RepID=A0A8J5MSD2_HOMAM|nr:Inactive dipeptidyl peptidase 10-like 1 [Homarus americanus]